MPPTTRLDLRGKIGGCAQSKALFFGLNDLDAGVLSSLKSAAGRRGSLGGCESSCFCPRRVTVFDSPLVLTMFFAVAVRSQTLDLCQAIYAAGVFAASYERRIVACKAGGGVQEEIQRDDQRFS